LPTNTARPASSAAPRNSRIEFSRFEEQPSLEQGFQADTLSAMPY